jgi:hypothetical protein
MTHSALCFRWAMALVVSLTMGLSSRPAEAQDKIQQLQGDFLGLARVGGDSFDLGLSIDAQQNRSFLGSALLPYIEQDNITIKGSIAASGNCTIQADSTDGKTTLKLDWQKFDGGAAVLTGQTAALDDRGVQTTAPVVFLRPFSELGTIWQNAPAQAMFQSAAGGRPITVDAAVFNIDPEQSGLFNAGFELNRETFNLVGTSSAGNQVVSVGVSDSLVITVTGTVTTDDRGVPTGIDGTYVIETLSGKLIDTGIIAILIGIRSPV